MKNPQKAKLTLVLFILMLLAGVGNLLWRLVSPESSWLTLVATVLFILSSIAGIVIVLSNMRGKP